MFGQNPKSYLAAGISLLWLGACTGGFAVLWRYADKPGAPSMVSQWPQATNVFRSAGKPTLIMALHPQCPCSVASIHELQQLLAGRENAIDTTILLVKPPHAPVNWNDTRLTRLVAAMPAIHIVDDVDALEAHRFGLRTSGAALLYDSVGHIQFTGGITASRGHEGDNAALDALTMLVDQSSPASHKTIATPVFGCPLESDSTSVGPKWPELSWAR